MYICVGYLSLCACVWVHDIREFLRTIYHPITISKYHNIEILLSIEVFFITCTCKSSSCKSREIISWYTVNDVIVTIS